MISFEEALRDLSEKHGSLAVRRSEPLSLHTTFRIGGPAAYWIEVPDPEALSAVTALCREKGVPCTVLGGGSNVLAADAGFPGAVIHLNGSFRSVEVSGSCIRAGGGASLRQVSETACRRALSGFEWATGIPGTVGGALAGNAGTQSGEAGDLVSSVTLRATNGETAVLSPDECGFAYRSAALSEEGVIAAVEFSLTESDSRRIRTAMNAITTSRRARQPLSQPSAGCVFRNPPAGGGAGALIDRAGLKGASVGDAAVSEVHANFIVNRGNARAADVLELIRLVRLRVARMSGVALELEIRTLGCQLDASARGNADLLL